MQALYQFDVLGDYFLEELTRFLKENAEDEIVYEMADEWSRKSWENLDACDELVKTAAIKWKLSRLSSVDRSILRLAAYQLGFCPDIPGKVVINEAIELAKKFSSEQSPRFVNGVLDAILRKLKSEGRD
jgi:N utilization substance protein B